MIENCIDNLKQIKKLTQDITDSDFQKPCEMLFQSSIGQHIRHSLEFYLCLFKDLEYNIVNYDERKRQIDIETETQKAAEVISEIVDHLENITQNKDIEVKANYTADKEDEICMQSSLYRELGFCLEHCVHHQALIKTGLKELNRLNLVDQRFGVAPSTLRNQNQCAQ